MKLNRNGILIINIILLTTLNIAALFNSLTINKIIISTLLLLLPGYLIKTSIKLKNTNIWRTLVYIVGFSISFWMIGGFIINEVLQIFHINNPLIFSNVLIGFDFLLIGLIVLAFNTNRNYTSTLYLPTIHLLDIVFYFVAILFPILAILGAMSLNNNGSNIITMFMLGTIAVYVFSVYFLSGRLNRNVFPFAIISICIALLLMFSLRSWYVLGWDISKEFQVFQVTRINAVWSMNNFPNDPYNACLSITILPTILQLFLRTNDQYIYKLIMPIIFSFTSICSYVIFKKYIKYNIAFISSFFLISQSVFFNVAPTLVRQEIGLLFFGLFGVTLLDNNLTQFQRQLLLIVYGLSMILSHYSTAYVAIAIFILCYFINKILERVGKVSWNRSKLSGTVVLMLLLLTFFWYGSVTNASGGVLSIIGKTFISMNDLFRNNSQGEGAKLALGRTIVIPYSTLLINQVNNDSNFYQVRYGIKKIESSLMPDYPTSVVYPEIPYGINIKLANLFSKLYWFLSIIFKISFAIGLIYLLFFKRYKKNQDMDYISITVASAILIGGILVFPYVSTVYNFERLYLQGLIFLSLICILGVLGILNLIPPRYRYKVNVLIVYIFFIIIFMFQSNFLVELVNLKPVGEYVHLNNYGDYYNTNYNHKSEIASAEWLSGHYDKNVYVYADEVACLKLKAFANISSSLTSLFPATIDKNAYVYSSYTNIVKHKAFVFYSLPQWEGTLIGYNFPSHFLNDYKNKIYNNATSAIYK